MARAHSGSMRMTMTGPWGMREAEQLVRQVAGELVETLEPNGLRIVNEGGIPSGFVNRQVEWYHEGRLVLGTTATKTTETGPSRHLRTAWFGDDAGASWRRVYAACCKFSESVTLSDDDCLMNARDMLYIHNDAGTTMWFLHKISGTFEPLAMTLYGEVMAELNKEDGV